MPNITRGGRMGGLLVYLAGEGRHNEHVEPHLVAGDSSLMAWHDDAELDRDSALSVAAQLDKPRRAFGTRVTQPIRDAEGHKIGRRDAHVWHCSLSLRAGDGPLSDERWAHISEQLVARMGFADPAQGRPPCRWVALRHGASRGGNDHVHVVVGLVHEDGRKADVHHDRSRAQRVAGELEREFGLEVLESREAGRGSRGHKPAEQARAQREGAPEVDRVWLARTVRGCAAAASDEAEFVRRVRRAGVQIRPRYAAGAGEDVVAGYSAARQPPPGRTPVWYGGGHLARDLTLPRLRREWPDSPQAATAAAGEWKAAKRQQRPVTPGREADEPDPKLWAQYSQDVGALREHMRGVALDDRESWAHVARETAGAFAAWSLRVEETPGPLAATADTLARSAQLRARPLRPRSAASPSAKGAALLLASVAHQGRGTVAQAVLIRQLSQTVRALHDAHVASGEANRAREIRDVMRSQLETFAAGLPVPDAARDEQAEEAVRLANEGQLAPRAPGSPLPATVDKPASVDAPTPNRDTEVQR